MDTVDYKNIITRDKLKSIKNLISSCGYRFDYNKCLDVDIEFERKINALLNDDSYADDLKYMLEKSAFNNKNDTETILVMYYFALYNNTVDNMKELVESDFRLKNKYMQYELFSLDKEFIKYFNKEEFLNLFEKCRDEMSIFYKRCFLSVKSNLSGDRKSYIVSRLKKITELLFFNSSLGDEEKNNLIKEVRVLSIELNSNLKHDYDSNEREQLMTDFSKIIRTNPNIAKVRKNKETKEIYYNLLTPDVIMNLGVDVILKLNENQKSIVDRCFIEKDLNCSVRLKHILKKYHDYNNRLPLTKNVLNNFTDEELYNMTEYEINIYSIADSMGMLERVKKLYLQGVIFNSNGLPLTKEVLTSMTDSEILELSSKTISKINDLYRRNSINFSDKEDIVYAIKKLTKKGVFAQKVKKLIS